MSVSVLELYEAHESSWRLKRKLARENPGVFIYIGVSVERPIQLTVYSNTELDKKPKRWVEYDVQYIENRTN